MHHTQLSCWRPPSGGHGKGTWEDESSRRQQPDPSIASLAHWVGNANQPDAAPIRAVFAGGNGPFGIHDQTIKDDSTEPASQQWAVPCNGGVLFHSVAGCVRLLLGFDIIKLMLHHF